MRVAWVLAIVAMLLAIGCKKSDNNSPVAPSPPDTWLRVIKTDSVGEFGRTVVEMPDGGFTIAGDRSGGTNGNLLLRVNSLGDTLWSRTFVADGYLDDLNGLVALPDGGVIAVGRITPSGHSSEETLMIRTNSSGGVVWQHITDIQQGFAGWGVATLNGGNFMVATLAGLIKINANGDTLWTRQTSAELFRVIGLSDGGAIATGSLYHDSENSSAYLLRCNAQGDTLWTREFPMSGDRVYAWDVTRTGDGDYVAVGSWTDFPTSFTGGTWAAKFSESGQVRWTNTYTADATFEGVATGSDGLPVVVGGVRQGSFGEGDILLMKLDNSGAVVWTKTYLSGNDEYGYGITATADGGFLVVGTISGVSGEDVILIKVDANGEL